MMGADPKGGSCRALKWVATGKRYVIYESTQVSPDVETVASHLYVRPRDDEGEEDRAQQGLHVIERIEDDEGVLLTSLEQGEGDAVLYMFRKVN
jgi:hypothetical protein